MLLARRISYRLGLPLLPHACERARNTPLQSALPWKERDKNMRQAFTCKPDADVRGKHVAIVDDVMTTGASIGELAQALKRAGAPGKCMGSGTDVAARPLKSECVESGLHECPQLGVQAMRGQRALVGIASGGVTVQRLQ